MTPSSAQDQSIDLLVGRAAEEFIEQLDRGEQPDVEAYAGRYPEHAEVIRQVLSSLQYMRLPAADAAADSESPLPGFLGDFHLLREVGRGGMGIVYEAEQISLNRRVALKILPFASTLDSRQLQRFKNEAQAAACLHHTHIVPIFATGVERGVHYYAMQFIEGHTLAQVVEALRPKSEPRTSVSGPPEQTLTYVRGSDNSGEICVSNSAPTAPLAELSTLRSTKPAQFYRAVAELGIQAAEALDHAHEQGIVHRDIKPGNLLLDAQSRLWITDFGLAHVQTEASLTMTGDLVGTLRYMSPEQALAKRVIVDHRTDIYSLGATLYELLTLEPAFDGKDRQELLRQLTFEEPKSPRRINKAVPAELETIVLKAMEKNPADRYATAKELASDLRRYLEDKSIVARRPGLVLRARKWGRRHPAAMASTAVTVAVVLLMSLGFVIWHNRDLDEKNRELLAAKETAEQREAETKAVLEFVENKILAAARPEGQKGGLGHDVTLRKAIEAALPFVESSFTQQPLIEARLRMTVGTSFLYLGEAKAAEEQLEKARTIRTKLLGADHPDTLTSMFWLANSYTDLGRYTDALKLCEETLALRKAKLGPDHPDTHWSMNNLANSYDILGRHADVLKLREETLALRKAKLGPDHPDTLVSMSNLANSY